ncbi:MULTISPECIES: hypothetical protein [unclassified Helicobacter]|uniref:hypothetical protein n=1 Tax=unclassified Helicobacter TaxID=2593540 RepID=UPI000CF1860F|nr:MULTISPECIES: hypothetical protein [unclassified Helicobacter]
MKITSHTAMTARMPHKTEQEVKKELKESINTSKKDSLKINTNNYASDVKEINLSIGSLQVAEKSLQKLQEQAKYLINQKDLSSKEYKSLNSIFQTSTFNGKNVFDKDYKSLSSNLDIDYSKIKEYVRSSQDIQGLKKLIQETKIQQNQTKKAISVLQNKLNNSLATSKNYNHLDSSMLSKNGFKNAHDTQNLSLNRVLELLA